jgi:hypothetical protein
MAAKKQTNIPEGVLATYEKLVMTIPNLERKGATIPYTSYNGNMFSFLAKDGSLALRLPEDERDAFMKKYKTGLVEANGAIMKEYVAVPKKLQTDIKSLKPYFNMSFAYVKSLKPKPTKKK